MSDILVPGWGWGLLVRFILFYGFRTCRVGPLECACLIPPFRICDRNFQKLLQLFLPDVTQVADLTSTIIETKPVSINEVLTLNQLMTIHAVLLF